MSNAFTLSALHTATAATVAAGLLGTVNARAESITACHAIMQSITEDKSITDDKQRAERIASGIDAFFIAVRTAIRASLTASPGARKSAEKSNANNGSAVRRALALGVAIVGADGKAIPAGKLEIACQNAERIAMGGTDDATDDAPGAGTGTGANADKPTDTTGQALAQMTAERDALVQALAQMTAERDSARAERDALVQALAQMTADRDALTVTATARKGRKVVQPA